MTHSTKGSCAPATSVQLSYQLLRNVTSPDEKSNGMQCYVANVSAFEVLKVETRENLRDYIGEHNSK
ncbi:MAG TPA: hypothetical protein QF804_03560, partial [Rhodospirillales bacterium]|nr:hypothetical protein [Rhodospirillales bacterium]